MRTFRKPVTAKVKGKLCWSNGEPGFGAIELRQNGVDRFTVAYGMQVDSELSYSEAASALGSALMHFLACESKLDNREVGEK